MLVLPTCPGVVVGEIGTEWGPKSPTERHSLVAGLPSEDLAAATAAPQHQRRPLGLTVLSAAWAVVVVWACGAVAWSWQVGFHLVGGWHILLIGAALLLVSAAYRRRDHRVANMFAVTALWIAM